MAGNTVNGGGDGARSGAQTLLLLAVPLVPRILRALADGPAQRVQLLHKTGFPAQTTLRAQLTRLHRLGAMKKTRRNLFPGTLEYELTATGHDLRAVAEMLERWLEQRALTLESSAAKVAIKALAQGWSTAMLGALAVRPLSLTELSRTIVSLSYPSLERRLTALRLAGLVKAQAGDARSRPYEVTEWAREGIGPIAAATRWERRHLPQPTAPFARLEVEAFFVLSVPLLTANPKASGSCRLAMELSSDGERRLAGVVARIERGKVVECTPGLQGGVDAWAGGSATAWLEAIVGGDLGGIERGGDAQLVGGAIRALHRRLCAPPLQTRI